jgi:hypothetical protein
LDVVAGEHHCVIEVKNGYRIFTNTTTVLLKHEVEQFLKGGEGQ